jgi:hypothetical protein
MEEIRGLLKTLGESSRANQGITYSYIEINDRIIKKPLTFSGLNGKIDSNIGEVISLYLDGSCIVAVTDKDGKTYSSESPSGLLIFGLYIAILGSVILSLFVITMPLTLPIIWNSIKGIKIMKSIERGTEIPGVIQLPRV